MITYHANQYLILRHGETDYTKKQLLQGWLDIPLNAAGIQQSEAVSRQLKTADWDVIIASNLLRAHQTAQIFCNHLNIPLLLSSRLRERFYGTLQGMDISLAKDLRLDNANINLYNYEQKDEFMIRVKNGFMEVNEIFDHKRIILITHGAWMKNLYQLISTITPGRFTNVQGFQLVHQPQGGFEIQDFSGGGY